MENLVTTLQTAQKLDKLGINPESLFKWVKLPDKWVIMSSIDLVSSNQEPEAILAAFTASELSEKYPAVIWITMGESNLKRKEGLFYFIKHEGIYKVSLMIKGNNDSDLYELHREQDQNEAEARGRMLIFLKERNMVDAI